MNWRLISSGLITHLAIAAFALILFQCPEVKGVLHNYKNQIVSWLTQESNRSVSAICEGLVIFQNTNATDSTIPYGSNATENSILVIQSPESLLGFLLNGQNSRFQRICLFATPSDLQTLWTFTDIVIQFNQRTSQEKFKPWNPLTFVLWPDFVTQIDEIQPVLRNKIPLKLVRNLGVDSDFYFIFRTVNSRKNSATGNDLKLSVWETYSFKGTTVPVINRIKNRAGFQSKLIRRSNFHGARIVAVTAEDFKTKPESDWVVTSKDKVRFTSGFAVSILKYFRDSLNFNDDHILGDWFQQHPNNTVMGKTADYLNTGQADIMIGHSVLQPIRARQLQFLQPTLFNTMKVFLQQPPASSIKNMFLAPFKSNLWASVASAWLVTVGFMFIFRMVTCKINCDDDDEINSIIPTTLRSDLVEPVSFGEVLLWGVGLICQQSWYKQPRTTSIKILFAVGSLCGWILNMAYVAAIVAVLSVENIPIKNLNSFLDSGLPLFVSGNSSSLRQFATNLFKERPELNRLSSPFLPISEGVVKVFEQPVAFLSYGHLFHLECQDQKISDIDRCDKIYTFPVTTSPIPGGMVVPKNSSFVEIFNYKILQFKEKGYIRRSTTHYNFASSITCIRKYIRYRETLGIEDTLTAYLILVLGHLFSFILLLLEKASVIAFNRTGLTELNIEYFK